MPPALLLPSPVVVRWTRPLIFGSALGVVILGLLWELWLAPLRPGGSMLALKVLPLVAALPGFWLGRLRTYQWWSMLILLYVCEGIVRGMSDRQPSASLAWLEALLAVTCYVAILVHARAHRRPKAPATPR